VARASDDENDLINYLFVEKDYNTLIRPVKNRSDTLEVLFEMALIQLITLVRRKNKKHITNRRLAEIYMVVVA